MNNDIHKNEFKAYPPPQLTHYQLVTSIFCSKLLRLDDDFLEKVIKIIKDNSYSETLDVEFIAQNVYMSHSTLYRKIKALTGLSIKKFVRKIKMHYAEELLLTGKYTVSEVGFHVGINSVIHFRECFKDEFGTLPSEYVRNLKNYS